VEEIFQRKANSISLPPTLQDISLSELPTERKKALSDTALTWFSSVGFCSDYSEPQADRIWIWLDQNGKLLKGFCYREENLWGGFFKCLHIYGPVQLTSSQIRGLMRHRKAHLAKIYRMGSNEVSIWGDDPFYLSRVERTIEDIIIELPAFKEDYLNSLGKNARKQLPYYLRRLEKECKDGFEVFTASGPEISQEMITDLVSLNRERLKSKNVKHLWTENLKRHRWLLAQEKGFLFGLKYEGNLLSGVLSYIYQNEAYMSLIGHNMRYDSSRLGKLTLYLTIERLIDQGIRRYHLLWGRQSYKYQLGGIEHPLYEVHVFSKPYVAVLWRTKLDFQNGIRRGKGLLPQFVRDFWHLLRRRSNEDGQKQQDIKNKSEV